MLLFLLTVASLAAAGHAAVHGRLAWSTLLTVLAYVGVALLVVRAEERAEGSR